jgi:hypothetical protein
LITRNVNGIIRSDLGPGKGCMPNVNFRPFCLAALQIAVGVAFAAPASAQYYYPQTDPCAPPGPGLAGIVNQFNAAQRAQACQQERDAVMRQQQAAYAAAQAQQQAVNAAAQAREAEAQRAAAQARAEEGARVAAVAAAQTAAETSPDNFCRQPDTARNLIDQYNGMDWAGLVTRRVVDIEHLVTIKKDPESATLICHGVWVHTNGMKLEGTMTLHPNVAGDIIVSWDPGHWEPPISTWVKPQQTTASASSAPAMAPSSLSSAFEQGLADRQALEAWFASSSGDYHRGALYWAAQRSLPHPGSCTELGGDATAGCLASQARLDPSDARRKREPDYRQGWNSYSAQ